MCCTLVFVNQVRKVMAPIIAAGTLAGCAPTPESAELPQSAMEDFPISTIEWGGYPSDPQIVLADVNLPDATPLEKAQDNNTLALILPGGDEQGALCDGDREQMLPDAEFYASIGITALRVDKPIYPAPELFCENTGEDTEIYLEGFNHYQQIVEDAYKWAKLHRKALDWNGVDFLVHGYSFGGTEAIFTRNGLFHEVVPGRIVSLSGFVIRLESEVELENTEILKIDFEEDTGFSEHFQKPDPQEDCDYVENVSDSVCNVLWLPGAGHHVNIDGSPAYTHDGRQTTTYQAIKDFVLAE